MTNFGDKLPPELSCAVLSKSEPLPDLLKKEVKGYDFEKCGSTVDFNALLSEFSVTTGFQSTSFGQAVNEINRMIDCKFSTQLTHEQIEKQKSNPIGREPTACTIFLGYTSNLISAGTRETIRYLVQNNMVDCLVTTAGGIEEDFIKCLAPTFVGSFHLPGKELYKKSINRIGNLLEPNTNYCLFEDWLVPILDQMLVEEKQTGQIWTPSKVIHRLGKEINNEESVYYWAYKNNIPVFCPALTDGSIGDMLFFHTFKNDGRSVTIDIVQDVRLMNMQAFKAINSGMIIFGGGVVKHHICNANLMRNGADFSVFVNTANEFDGSDSGARPDEAVSWGKIKATAHPVKVYGEASFIMPLLVSQTFFSNKHLFSKDATTSNSH